MSKIELMNERKENLLNAVNRRPAKWVPLISINSFGAFGYAGKSYWEVEKDHVELPKAVGKVYELLPADASTGDTPSCTARADEILEGCCQYKITGDGLNLQHLQDSKMLDTDYEQAIADPKKFIREVILPRRFPWRSLLQVLQAAD